MIDDSHRKRGPHLRPLSNTESLMISVELWLAASDEPRPPHLDFEEEEGGYTIGMRMRFLEREVPVGEGFVRARLNYAVVRLLLHGLQTADRRVSRLHEVKTTVATTVHRQQLEEEKPRRFTLGMDIAAASHGSDMPLSLSIGPVGGKQTAALDRWSEEKAANLLQRLVAGDGQRVDFKVSAAESAIGLDGYTDIFFNVVPVDTESRRIKAVSEVRADTCLELYPDRHLKAARKTINPLLHMIGRTLEQKIFKEMERQVLNQSWSLETSDDR